MKGEGWRLKDEWWWSVEGKGRKSQAKWWRSFEDVLTQSGFMPGSFGLYPSKHSHLYLVQLFGLLGTKLKHFAEESQGTEEHSSMSKKGYVSKTVIKLAKNCWILIFFRTFAIVVCKSKSVRAATSIITKGPERILTKKLARVGVQRTLIYTNL